MEIGADLSCGDGVPNGARHRRSVMNLSGRVLSGTIAAMAAVMLLRGGLSAQAAPRPQPRPDTILAPPQRDGVGDLNAAGVQAGSFPGAIVLPGTAVSLAIGGFIKTVGIFDSNLEVSGSQLLPGTFTSGVAGNGNFSMDATLSRFFFDGRAPVDGGLIRGYIEWDLNSSNSGTLGFSPRLAFGTWQNRHGTLLAGHNWSTLMDMKIIPESLTEPTVSGAIFSRQAQIRWSQRLGGRGSLDLAVEDANAVDLLSTQSAIARSVLPDIVAGAEVVGGKGHLRASGILRRLESRASAGTDPSTGWGVAVSGRLNGGGGDRIAVQGSYGKGIARYILGNGPRSGGIIDPETGRVRLLKNWGGLVTARHGWTAHTRSTAALGHAETEVPSEEPDAFKSTSYAFLNLMHSPLPFVTFGVEYAYARLELRNGDVKDDHRLVFGVQIY